MPSDIAAAVETVDDSLPVPFRERKPKACVQFFGKSFKMKRLRRDCESNP
jgi:hypothetical protein